MSKFLRRWAYHLATLCIPLAIMGACAGVTWLVMNAVPNVFAAIGVVLAIALIAVSGAVTWSESRQK